jgi:DNA-binding response OmpR family regulator
VAEPVIARAEPSLGLRKAPGDAIDASEAIIGSKEPAVRQPATIRNTGAMKPQGAAARLHLEEEGVHTDGQEPSMKVAPDGEAPVSIVYVEDDERLARLTMQYLVSHGVQVCLVHRGDHAVGEILRVRPDLVLLDVMLPGMSGLEICRALRERLDVPILMVTARTEEADRVIGLEGGADDYIGKPFSSRELLARIRAHSRRARGAAGPRTARIDVGNLSVDAGTMSATLAGERLLLTTFEFALLRVLAERAGRVLTREQLLQLVHAAGDEAFDRSIDVHVSRLRAKLRDDSRHPTLLKTIRGVGYMLCAPDEP